jgi:hypothetical protein
MKHDDVWMDDGSEKSARSNLDGSAKAAQNDDNDVDNHDNDRDEIETGPASRSSLLQRNHTLELVPLQFRFQ